MIGCRVLGPIEVTDDAKAVPPELLWRKHLALLVYLALSPKRTRTREHLIGLLWGDKSEAAARHSLREAVRILRQTLGAEAVETVGQQIRLAEGTVALDTEEFARLAGAQQWDLAAALVVGDFLDGFSVPDASAFEDWLDAQRVEWRRQAAEVLRRHAEGCLHGGRTAEAVLAARRAVGLEPVSDLAVQTLMRAEALQGDRAAALDAYATFAQRLRRETGGEPAAASVDLAERIRRSRGPRPPGPKPEPDTQWTRRAPLVGRAGALARLVELWELTAGGRGAAIAILEGDLGHGRTRLIEELGQRVALSGGAVASALAVRSDRQEPWSGVIGLARGGLADAPGVAAARREALAAFTEHIPAWADRFPAARGGSAAGLGPAFREVLAAATGERPVLLAVDDAQWLDDESLLALQATARDLARARVMLVLSVLPDARHPVLDELRAGLGETWHGEAIPLDRLTNADVAALAAWALPRYAPDALDRVTRRVAVDSAGIPLLVVELLHAITLGLEPEEAEGAWPAPFRTLSHTLPADLPDAVVGAVRVGFRGLSSSAQAVLAAMAVLPDRLPDDLLGRVTELDPASLHASLDELEWQRWIVAESRGYAFVARIVKDIVARDMLTPGQKRRVLQAADLTPS